MVGALLEFFHQDADTGAVKIQNLNPVMSAIGERKESALLGIFAELVLRSGPESVEAGAQIAGFGRQEDSEVGMETQHGFWSC